MPTSRAFAVLLCAALALSGCTFWLSADASGVHIGGSAPDVFAPGTEAPHAPTPTPEIVQWTPIPTTIPCTITNANSYAVNVRNAPGGAVVGVLAASARAVGISSATDGTGRVWREIENPAGFVAGWVVQVDAGC